MPTEADAERKARHLAQVQELQSLAMGLARRVAAKAEQTLDQPAEPDAPRPPDHVLQFVRLSRLLNHAMVLETRIANDDLLRQPSARTWRPATHGYATHRPPDPRRALLRTALHRAAAPNPDRARLRRDLDAHLEAELQADPDHSRHPAEILVTIAQAADLPIDLKDVSDELLGFEPPYRPPQ